MANRPPGPEYPGNFTVKCSAILDVHRYVLEEQHVEIESSNGKCESIAKLK